MTRLPFSFTLFAVILVLSAGCKTKKTEPAVVADAPPEKKVVAEGDKMWATAVADLSAKSAAKRASAVRVLGQYDAAQAIPVLLAALNDKSYSENETIFREPNSTREAAILGLQRFGKQGEQAAVTKGLPILRQALSDPDDNVKVHALMAIMLLGPAAKDAGGDVLLLCESKDDMVRRTAFDTLPRIGAANPVELSLMLGSSDPKVVYDAAKALNAVRPLPKDIVPALVALIEKPAAKDDPDEAVLARHEVAEALGSMGADAEAAVPALVSQLKMTTEEEYFKFIRNDGSRKTGRRPGESPTMTTLRKIGKPAVAPLAEILTGDKPFATWQAIRVLGGIGPDAKDAIPVLQKIFDKEADRADSDIVMMAASGLAIAQIGGDTAPIVSKFTSILDFAREDQKLEVAWALSFFGRKGAPAAAAIAKLLNDENEDIRYLALAALIAFGPGAKEALPALETRLADPNFDVRRIAVQAIKSLGPNAVTSGPALSKALADEDEAFRRDVLEAIVALGPGSKVDVKALTKFARVPDERDRLLALEALGAMGPDAKSAVPELLADLRDGRRDLIGRVAIFKTLGRIGDASPDTVKALAGALQDSAMAVRLAAVKSIAGLGPAAKGAEDAVRKFGKNLQAPDEVAGVWSAVAQYKMGVNTDAAIKYIVATLKNRSPAAKPARLAAFDAAVFLGLGAKGVVPELLEALNDRTPLSKDDPTTVGIRAAQALGKMGPASKDAVKKLTALLKEPDPVQKKVVIETLGEIGPDAGFAAARLREIARTEPQFAEAALAAVEKIEKQ